MSTERVSSPDAIRIPRAAELVAGELRRRIVIGALLPGDQLPTEAMLVEQFQVARTSVREALRILESEGLVKVRRGPAGGGQVCDPDPRTVARYASLLLQFEGATVEDVHRSRILIEPAAAGWLARRPDHAAVATDLSTALGAEDATQGDPHELARTEGRFHQLVTRLTGNETLALLCSVSNLIIAHQVSKLFSGDGQPAGTSAAGFLAAHRTHARFVEMIAVGDAAAVEQLWRHHLEEAFINLRPVSHMTILDLMS